MNTGKIYPDSLKIRVNPLRIGSTATLVLA
jgi:hypothetical protein